MKVQGFTRFLLGVFALISTIIFLVVAVAMAGFALSSGWVDLGEAESFLSGHIWVSVSGCAVCLVLALVGLRLLFARAPMEPATLLLKGTDHGQIYIALSALDAMVLRAARKVNGLRDIQSKVMSVDNALSVRLKVSFMPDVGLPAATEELQSAVKAYVEETAGIVVRDVSVFIDSMQTAAPMPARVE